MSPEQVVESAVRHMIGKGYWVAEQRAVDPGGYGVTFARRLWKPEGSVRDVYSSERTSLTVTRAEGEEGCRIMTGGGSEARRNELEWHRGWAEQGHYRSYRASELPALLRRSRQPSEREEKVLMGLYGEVCGSWRTLTDVRFKLLGLVPVVSGVVLVQLLSGRTQLAPGAGAGIALFGLVVTVALWIYETRNSELYDDLVSRGRRIEEELGVGTGHFKGRLKPSSRYLSAPLRIRIPMQHDIALNLIYGSSVAAWLLALLAISLGV